jgi:serine/threonine protein kinase
MNKYFGHGNEQMYKKLAENMAASIKKAEQGSEFGAQNLTQITDYRLGKHLGSGAYASVKKATHKLTGMVLAIKIYEKFKLMESHRKKNVIREIMALKKLQGDDCVVKLYDVIDTPKQLYLVLEFVKGKMLS